MVTLQKDRPKVRRAIMAVHLANGFGHEHARPVQEIANSSQNAMRSCWERRSQRYVAQLYLS